MELTFRVKQRGNSLNFLEKFKDKISRVDKYSGIMGILGVQPNRFRCCETEQSQSDPLQSRAVSDCSLKREMLKKVRVTTQPAHGQQNFDYHNLIKSIKKEKDQNQHVKQNKKGEPQIKRETATIVLPPIKMSRNENSLYLNRMKKAKRQKAKLNWLAAQSSKEVKLENMKVRQIR